MMETETISETLGTNFTLTWLIAQKDYTEGQLSLPNLWA
jgi:hypothetical protein